MFFSLAAHANLNVTTFYVELKNFPTALKTEWENIIEQMATSDSCFNISGEAVLPSSDPGYQNSCHRFAEFKNMQQLKPYRRISTHRKMLLSYKGPEEEVGVQVYDWDGKKLRRIGNSGSKLAGRSIKDFMVSWSFK